MLALDDAVLPTRGFLFSDRGFADPHFLSVATTRVVWPDHCGGGSPNRPKDVTKGPLPIIDPVVVVALLPSGRPTEGGSLASRFPVISGATPYTPTIIILRPR